MRRCINCVLPETFPGIVFNEDGICNSCLAFKGRKHLQQAKLRYKQKFENLINQYQNQSDYDCLMAYSGGKDSTFTLSVLKEKYGLNILAVTFDNGFISPVALRNIGKVVENLAIDHMIMKPRIDILKKIFIESSKNGLYSNKTIERASTICTTCMGLVKFISLKIALEKNIPFITYGWSPGQAPIAASIFKNNPTMLKQMQGSFQKPLQNIVGESINSYFLDIKDYEENKNFPYNISPLAFLEYNEEAIYKTIRKMGWQKPGDTDANSTNCLLNSLGNVNHKERYGFHPYTSELSKLVREGYLNREIAICKLETTADPIILQIVEQKLYN
jgi:tRNA(Ile)-lysidine synthase TilS/MesJ